MKFPCSQCGECCRHIDLIPELTSFNPGDGVCVHLHGNLCDIYEDRPEICRVDFIYDKYFSNQLSEEEFFALNLEGCKEIIQYNKIHNKE